MKCLIILFLLFPIADAFSKVIYSKIVMSYESKNSHDPNLLFLDNGDVIFFDRKLTKSFKRLKSSFYSKRNVVMNVDEHNNFISFLGLNTKAKVLFQEDESSFAVFYPTELQNISEADAILKRMRLDYQKRSQCYNRAHVWAWEEFNRSGLMSKKYFLFFTVSYILRYRFKWWFHVAPAVVVKGQGDRILDPVFFKLSRTPFQWTRGFITSGKKCPIINKYSEYSNHQELEDCYLLPLPMYYWHPKDIQRRDIKGKIKSKMYKKDLFFSYLEAF